METGREGARGKNLCDALTAGHAFKRQNVRGSTQAHTCPHLSSHLPAGPTIDPDTVLAAFDSLCGSDAEGEGEGGGSELACCSSDGMRSSTHSRQSVLSAATGKSLLSSSSNSKGSGGEQRGNGSNESRDAHGFPLSHPLADLASHVSAAGSSGTAWASFVSFQRWGAAGRRGYGMLSSHARSVVAAATSLARSALGSAAGADGRDAPAAAAAWGALRLPAPLAGAAALYAWVLAPASLVWCHVSSSWRRAGALMGTWVARRAAGWGDPWIGEEGGE
jgi:hypothetical protein